MTELHDTPRYWFPAKRYGWGWGAPLCWQGWVVVALYAAALVAIVVRWRPEREPIAFLVLTAVASLLLVGICWLKGEPPRWRWGDD